MIGLSVEITLSFSNRFDVRLALLNILGVPTLESPLIYSTCTPVFCWTSPIDYVGTTFSTSVGTHFPPSSYKIIIVTSIDISVNFHISSKTEERPSFRLVNAIALSKH